MAESQTLRFVHHFSRSVSCEMQVADQPPDSGETFPAVCQWSGPGPKPKHIPAYRQWILYTTQLLADRWQKRILYGLGVAPNRTEFWAFEPGAAPKLLKKLDYGIS
jgi:hypothetical protein